jgi:hypothetical protein
MDIETIKVMATATSKPTATIHKDSYVLASEAVDPVIAAELSNAQALDHQIKTCKATLDETLKRIRKFGEQTIRDCRRALGGDLLTVKIPYADEHGSERVAAVTASRRYTVKKGVVEAREDLGDAYSLFEVVERHVLTPKGLDVVRGLLARSGLTGKQIEAAIEQMCEVETTVSAVEDFDERAAAMASMEAALARSFVTRAAASVKP